MVLSAQRLCYIRIEKSDKTKGPEGSGNKHVGDLAKLGEILAQVVRVYVLCTAAHEDLAWYLMSHALGDEKG